MENTRITQLPVDPISYENRTYDRIFWGGRLRNGGLPTAIYPWLDFIL